jgi:hypothetical protein
MVCIFMTILMKMTFEKQLSQVFLLSFSHKMLSYLSLNCVNPWSFTLFSNGLITSMS